MIDQKVEGTTQTHAIMQGMGIWEFWILFPALPWFHHAGFRQDVKLICAEGFFLLKVAVVNLWICRFKARHRSYMVGVFLSLGTIRTVWFAAGWGDRKVNFSAKSQLETIA